MSKRSRIRSARPVATGCLGFVFGGIFMLLGGGLFVWLSGYPILHWQEAQSWTETSCTILSSEVYESSDSDGSTYGIAIRYAYFFEGKEYDANRYNFFGGTSSGRANKQAVVDQYPAGSKAVCYVNPENPEDVVLSRAWTNAYLVGCFGLLFFFAGLAVAIGMLRTARNMPKRIAGSSAGSVTYSTGGYVGTVDSQPQELKSSVNPKQTLIGALVFTIIWYLVLGGVSWAFFKDGLGWDSLIPALILGVMLLGGLIGVAGVVKGFLGLWNPRVRLGMAPGALQLGATVALKWELDGDATRLQSLRILLQGTERATYRRGTNTSTDSAVFDKIVVAETTTVSDMRVGQIEFLMPEFTMHTLDLPNNKVQWVIRVEGSIPKWPDLEEEFPVTVLPMALAGGARPAQERNHD